MSVNFSVSISSPDLAAWIRDTAGEGKPYLNPNRLINEALRRLKREIEGLDPSDITFETEPVNLTETVMKEIKAEVGAHLTIDCLPPIPPGEHSHALHVSIRHEDSRLLDEAIKLPGLTNRTRGDLARSFIFVGLKALDTVKEINSPAWQTQLALADATIKRETRQRNEERLSAMVKNLKEDLLELMSQGRHMEALDTWRQFYEHAMNMEWFLREAALWSLHNMPISQSLIYDYHELLPDGFDPPVDKPDGYKFYTDIGVYEPGKAIESGNAGPIRINRPVQYRLLGEGK